MLDTVVLGHATVVFKISEFCLWPCGLETSGGLKPYITPPFSIKWHLFRLVQRSAESPVFTTPVTHEWRASEPDNIKPVGQQALCYLLIWIRSDLNGHETLF